MNQLDALKQFTVVVDIDAIRRLTPSTEAFHHPASLSEPEFRWEHNQDPMAVDKLAEGIRLFAADQQKLENLLAARL